MAKKSKKQNRREFVKTSSIAAGAVLLATGTPFGTALASSGRRWGFLIDLDNCIGCKACSVACKTEFEVPLGEFRSSVKELDEGTYPNNKRSFLPWLCNHCKNPVCLTDCPVDEVEAKFSWPDGTEESYTKKATYQRPDGIVLIDQDRCVGCGMCVEGCPYNVRFLNPAKQTTSEDAVGDNPADKCTLCVHRLDAGVVPACVNTCQSNARLIGDLNDPNSEISKRIKSKQVKVLLPEEGTDPQCQYVSLNPKTYSEGRDTK